MPCCCCHWIHTEMTGRRLRRQPPCPLPDRSLRARQRERCLLRWALLGLQTLGSESGTMQRCGPRSV